MSRPRGVDGKLRDQLSIMLPAPAHSLFLRACLHDAPGASEAWRRWSAETTRDGTSVRQALAESLAPFLPLLAWNRERNGLGHEDERLSTFLKFARVTEELRSAKYREACASSLGALHADGIPMIVLKGAALEELIYPAPALRHSGDVDVLLHEADLARGVAAFVDLGWRQFDDPILPSPLHLPPIVHPTGLPIELHRRLQIPYYTLPYDALWARSRPASVAGVEVRVLSPADNLLHILAHAMHGYGEPILRWVPDAWFIIARSPELDWSTFLSTAASARLGLPLYVTLEYLAREIGAHVPPGVLAELGAAAARTGFRGRAAARLGARRWATGSVRDIWATPGGARHRLARLCQRVFPPPVEFALRYDLPAGALPFYYLVRAARYTRRAPASTFSPYRALRAPAHVRPGRPAQP